MNWEDFLEFMKTHPIVDLESTYNTLLTNQMLIVKNFQERLSRLSGELSLETILKNSSGCVEELSKLNLQSIEGLTLLIETKLGRD